MVMKQHISEIACVISAFAALGCVQTAYAHTVAYMYGLFHGKNDGRNGLYDSVAACGITGVSLDNQQRCESGYTHGWTTTCKEALTNPYAQHDVYGCPGVSADKIAEVLNK